MNRNFILFYSIIFPCFLNSCKSKETSTPNPLQDGNWVYLGDFYGGARTEAVSFVIGNYAYLGTGIDNQNNRTKDFYKFDPTTSSWVEVASCTGMAPRNSAVAFTINGKGYVGSGYDGSNVLSDFWEYDPVVNSWSQKASIGDNDGLKPRYDAVAFAINQYGYVSTGSDGVNVLNDFWRYDLVADAWTKKSNFPGYNRTQAIAFEYNNKGYIVTGLGANGSLVNDFYSFDPGQPDTSAWKELRQISNFSHDSYDDGYTSIVRSNAVGFVMLNTKSDGGGDRAYITTGANQDGFTNTTWAYNFAKDLWNQKTSYERSAKSGGIGFTVQNRGFVGLGNNGSSNFINIDEWKPDETYNDKD
jgi:N-acetylneuraminic acid mutarotase